MTVRAISVAALVSSILLAGALGFQFLGGMRPCEMCLEQRFAHALVVTVSLSVMGLMHLGVRIPRAVVWLVPLLIAFAAFQALRHVGVETGVMSASCGFVLPPPGTDLDDLATLLRTPPAPRCDVVAWKWLGVSMAGWNLLISLGSAVTVVRMLGRRT